MLVHAGYREGDTLLQAPHQVVAAVPLVNSLTGPRGNVHLLGMSCFSAA